MFTLNELFHYVFGNRAQSRPAQTRELTQIQKDRQKEVYDQHKLKIQEKFAPVTSNDLASAQFRMLLRRINNADLESILYGNNTDAIVTTPPQVPFPSDAQIACQFETLNFNYKYLTADANSFKLFIQLFKACKLVADYIEKNNTEDDSVAYLHAYKMMVLFKIQDKKPFSAIDDFIRLHIQNAHLQKPIHDFLVFPLSPNEPPIKSLDDWKEIISVRGREAINLFQQAPEIDRLLQSEGQKFSWDEIQKATSKIKYTNFSEDPELAQLCLKYHVSEEVFNKCITISRKQSDLLPQVIVDGSKVGHAGYYLVKIPCDDPRSYILGHITNCCQSIGGHSEQSVIEGLTKPTSGFYALLRAKPTTRPQMDVMNASGKINYQNYSLVGQAYAWFSTLGNLVLDSWENLTPDRDDAVIVAMLPKFSEQCFDENSKISRVLIGTGGKTPAKYSAESERDYFPENIADGVQYSDSLNQVVVAMNPIILEEEKILKKKFEHKGVDSSTLKVWSIEQVACLNIFLDEANPAKYDVSFFQKLVTPELLHIIIQLYQTKILNTDFLKLLETKPLSQDQAGNIAELLRKIAKITPDLATPDNFSLMLSLSLILLECLTVILSHYSSATNNLITPKNFTLFFTLFLQSQDQYIFVTLLGYLYFIHPDLINEENLIILIKNLKNIEDISLKIRKLDDLAQEINEDNGDKVNVIKAIKADTGENFKLIIAYPESPIVDALAVLYRTSSKLVTSENRKLLIANMRDSHKIATAISHLHAINPAFTTQYNCDLLAKNINIYSRAVDCLSHFPPHLITLDLFNLLIEKAQIIEEIEKEIIYLNPIMTDALFKWFIINIDKMSLYVSLFVKDLYEFNHNIITNEDLDLCIRQPYSLSIHSIFQEILPLLPENLRTTEVLELLFENSGHFLKMKDAWTAINQFGFMNPTEKESYFKTLLSNAEFAPQITAAWAKLYESYPQLSTYDHYRRLVKNAEHAPNIFPALIKLKEIEPEITPDLLSKYFKYIVEDTKNAETIAVSFKTAHNYLKLNTESLIKTLANSGKDALFISSALRKLNEEIPQFFTENFDFILEHIAKNCQFAKKITSALDILKGKSPDLINIKNCVLLFNNACTADTLAAGLAQLYSANPDLINDENREKLAEAVIAGEGNVDLLCKKLITGQGVPSRDRFFSFVESREDKVQKPDSNEYPKP